jgi:hypothetical protein
VGGGDGRADPLLGQMGGRWALEIETFLGPVKFIEPLRECHLGPKKVVIQCGSAGIKNITCGPYKL